MDQSRTEHLKRLMLRSVEIELSVLPIVTTCLESAAEACQAIDCDADCAKIVECLQTGNCHPGDYEFVDLSNGGNRYFHARICMFII